MLKKIKQTVDSNFTKKLIEKNTLFKSQISHAFQAEHEHYFNKKEVMEFRKNLSSKSIADPRCVICGLRLGLYYAQIRYETMEIPAL